MHTSVFPVFQPLDIIMDLTSTTEPFLGGEAHAGMLSGTRYNLLKLKEFIVPYLRNLVSVAVPKIVKRLKKYPKFSLLIIGYSLGIHN